MAFLPTIALLLTLQAPTPPTASIAGVVVRAVTNEPISRARITIFRSDAPAANIPAVTTDDQGRFVFKDLSGGSYSLSAQRNGFASQPYGQREAGRGGGGTPVTVVAGQALNDIVFRLVPAAAVSGRVTDATGAPLLGVNIQILRAAYDANGKRTLQGVGGRPTATDDRGEYRAYLLPPGRF
jgi:hypothetical protein